MVFESEDLSKLSEKLTEKEIESRKKNDWLKFLQTRFDFPENYDLIRKEDLKKLKINKYLYGLMTGIFTLLGLGLIAGSILYGSYYDKFKSETNTFYNETLICNSTLICENNNNCPVNNCDCPTNQCGDVTCSNFTCPEVKIYLNSS